MKTLLPGIASSALWLVLFSALPAQPASAPADQLAERVEQQLKSHDDADGIRVSTREGTVILEGVVRTLSQRDRLISAAEKVPGVVTIDSRLQVKPERRTRAQIRKDVVAALEGDSATAYINPTITIDGDVVTLTGEAESATDALLATAIVKDIRGVSEVVDRLEIADSGRTDQEIQSDLEVELKASIVVNDPIEVEVQRGSVQLRGVVDTAFERSWSIKKAWGVRGVREVDASGLRIDPQLRAETSQERGVSSEDTRRAIVAAFRNDPRVRASQPKIVIDGRHVTLTGEVGTLAAKRRAEHLTRLVVGVSSVENQLKVTPGTVSDRQLEQQADAAFERNAVVDAAEVDVKANRGRVTLTGQVNSEIEKWMAEDLVAALPGATGITNQIEVRLVPEYEVGQRDVSTTSSPSE